MHPRIRNLRKAAELTQRELAQRLYCTQVCYSHYENGKRDIPTTTLEMLADLYAVSIDYLLGRTDCPDPYPEK